MPGHTSEWAHYNATKAAIGNTEEEAIERVRQLLLKNILLWDKDADIPAFSFTVSVSEVEDGAFWIPMAMSLGHRFKVHEFNSWR